MATAPYQEKVSCKYGAPMGRRSGLRLNDEPLARDKEVPLYLRRVPLVGNGDYDQGGAYWGSPADLWCAWSSIDAVEGALYLRAPDRETAKAQIKAQFPRAWFYR